MDEPDQHQPQPDTMDEAESYFDPRLNEEERLAEAERVMAEEDERAST